VGEVTHSTPTKPLQNKVFDQFSVQQDTPVLQTSSRTQCLIVAQEGITESPALTAGHTTIDVPFMSESAASVCVPKK
jgi:hypothetical protein